MTDTELLERARAWRAADPDPSTRDELEALLTSGDLEALRARFSGPLEFGTAGLRGVLGAGESRMNRAVVIRTSAGLGRTLLDTVPDAKTRGVVVGYDGRRGSTEFAHDAAGVFTALGLNVYLAPRCVPTPLVAFAVTHLDACAGVMVTASHNPPEYNGYKVYAHNGAQIVPPMDAEIAARIAAAEPANEVPRRSLDEAYDEDLLCDLGPAVFDAYLAGVAGLIPATGPGRELTIAYTPLHGVGAELTERVFAEVGFTNLHTVAEQREPDGGFPTVAFPNPEEDGAMDLVLALAKARGAELVLAQDPDADRLAVALPGPEGDGRWVQLTGNEVGVLLGHHALTTTSGDRLVMNSVVSSPWLGKVAQALGARWGETLTGFKWIANQALEQEQATGTRFVFGYEEALGYTVGTLVRDKDGVGAALAMADLAAGLKAKGQTLLTRLEELARAHGLWVSGQRSLRFDALVGQAKMAALMDRLRAEAPTQLGAFAVVEARDYATGAVTRADGSTATLDLPPTNLLVYELEGGHRILVRPSGTEPKLKIYADVCATLEPGEAYLRGRARAHEPLNALLQAVSEVLGV
ncbi:MAG: phospho-sugar mutase [Planctomycetes bacterium]|nr:phospho-sugar mutase [Planctomycetota bacterium]